MQYIRGYSLVIQQYAVGNGVPFGYWVKQHIGFPFGKLSIPSGNLTVCY